MKLTLLISLMLLPLGLLGQGLNAELGFNDTYHQYGSDVVVNGDYSYLLKTEWYTSSFDVQCSLTKLDSNGIVVWENPVNPQPGEVKWFNNMIPASNGGVYLFGKGQQVCDIGGLCGWFVQHVDPLGSTSTFFKDDFECWYYSNCNLTKANDSTLVFQLDSADISKVYLLDLSLNLVDSISTDIGELESVHMLNGYGIIGHREDSLYGMDGMGNYVEDLAFSTLIKSMEVFNDTVYVLTSDSLFSFDSGLQPIQAVSFTGFDNYGNLKIKTNQIEFVSYDGLQLTLHELDHALQVLETSTITTEYGSNTHLDFGTNQLVISENFNLSSYQTVRYRVFSRNDSTSASVPTGDIGVVDFEAVDIIVTDDAGGPPVYNVKIYGNALVKNFGTEPVEQLRLNHYIGMSIACGDEFFTDSFSGLNLLPGDSIWINCGLVHNYWAYLPSDTLNFQLCLYSSHANGVTDLNVTNDELCKNIVLGYVGIEELLQLEKEVVAYYDLLGREVSFKKNTLLIALHTDGTSEKVFVSE